MRMEVAKVGSERVADDREMMQILRCHLVMNRRARRGAPGRVPRMHVLKTSRDLHHLHQSSKIVGLLHNLESSSYIGTGKSTVV